MSPAEQPSPALPARGSGSDIRPDGHHTCKRCPVCASETCRTLQDLGMYCETQCAATEARAAEREARRGTAAA
jgi:hypothetical protein